MNFLVSIKNNISSIFSSPTLRNRILFTLGILFLYRFLANIPPAGVDQLAFIEVFRDNPLTNIFTLATGGSLDNPSLVMIGLGAYINASIIIQLLTSVIPKLEELKKEGTQGRKVLSQYTRWLTVPLSAVQALVFYILLSRSSELVSSAWDLDAFVFMAVVAAGSVFLMWLGELITESGIGNGTSILITFAIVASLPRLVNSDISVATPVFTSFFNGSLSFIEVVSTPSFLYLFTIVVGMVLLVAFMVYFNEAVRKITIQYARRVSGNVSNYLPLRVNQAGVMPVIFASALISFPAVIAQIMLSVTTPGTQINETLQSINGSFLADFNSFGYNVMYFLFIIFFTYFYNFVIQKPEDTTDNLKKSGAFIPGIRPGKATDEYIKTVLWRLSTIGAVFLAVISLLPTLARIGFGVTSQLGILSGIGGTSLLIVVSVFLTTWRQIISMVSTKTYDKYR